MTIKEFCRAQGFQDREAVTPAQGWHRAEDAILGGELTGSERETPPRRWRRASDTLTGGVNTFNHRPNAHGSQAVLPDWRLM